MSLNPAMIAYFNSKVGQYDSAKGTYMIKCRTCGNYDDISESKRNIMNQRSGDKCNKCHSKICHNNKCKVQATRMTTCKRFHSCQEHCDSCMCRVCG